MDASIIIPVHRDTAGLRITLESIRKLHWDHTRVEVIICNDGGGDEISGLAARYGCREARLDINRGSYAARNAGIRLARGRALAFVDADESLADTWLTAGLAALEQADYVGGRVVVEPGKCPTFWERVDATFAFPVAMYLAKKKYAPTANLFVRRKVFEEVGGFDESLVSGGDCEFGVRVSARRMTQIYCEAAITIHPARGFSEQLRKIRRTSRGHATLAILVWGRSATATGIVALLAATGKACQAAALAASYPFSGGGSNPANVRLLAAGRAMMGTLYNLALGLSAFSAAFERNSFRRCIPDVTHSP